MPSETIPLQGDTIIFPFGYDQDITGYKIRAELGDKSGNSIELANTASGGSDAQIIATDAINGEFNIIVAKNLTDGFKNKCYLEVELEDTSSPTRQYSYKFDVSLQDQKITWTEPS